VSVARLWPNSSIVWRAVCTLSAPCVIACSSTAWHSPPVANNATGVHIIIIIVMTCLAGRLQRVPLEQPQRNEEVGNGP
jgi:hypothetical protein